MTTITYKYEDLLKMKDTAPEAARLSLLKKAEKILAAPTLKMTDKKLHAPSGNIHDYMSCGLYWWPNPNTPDGLPYINKDGIVNPDSHDGISLGSVSGNIHTLALTAFYFEEKRAECAEYAERQLYDWFVNPETYMAPNAKYAQAIPGICEGRSTGLIDFAVTYFLFDGIGIFVELGLLKDETVKAVKAWFVEFTNWMLTHKNGIEMDNGNQNIGAWHDSQILSMALFTDRPELAINVCLTSYDRRIRNLIKPDGSMPTELARTKAIGYSFYALNAMMNIAAMAERLGFDYWRVDEYRGESILVSAIEFLSPLVIDPDNCPYPDLYKGTHRPALKHALLAAAKRYPDGGFAERAAALGVADDYLEPVK